MFPGRSVGWHVPCHSYPSSVDATGHGKRLPEVQTGAAAHRREDTLPSSAVGRTAAFRFLQVGSTYDSVLIRTRAGVQFSLCVQCSFPWLLMSTIPAIAWATCHLSILGLLFYSQGVKAGVSMILYEFPPPQFFF